MANAIPNRPGQNLGTGNDRELFIEKYITDVMTAFYTANVTEGRFMERDITEGKGAEFPVTGIAGGGFHTPGSEILGRKVKNTVKNIEVDGMLISDVFVAKIDELMNHWQVRQVYSTEQGKFLAKVNDYHKLLTAIKAARSQANIPGETGQGGRIVNAALKTDALALATSIFAARTTFDTLGVPQEDVAAYIAPAQMALLVLNKDVIDRNYGGAGSIASGVITELGGVSFVKTTHLPQGNFSTGNAQLDAVVKGIFGDQVTADGVLPDKYRLDASTTAGIVAHKSALGTVRLAGMELEMNYDFRRKGTLVVASQAQGTDVLRPEAAIELATGNL